MVKFNLNMDANKQYINLSMLILNTLLVLCSNLVEARDRGDDIIMTKGKLIVRGGRNKGNLILDTGSKSSEHQPIMPMMPMMGSHFNPFAFYPMHHQHGDHQPMIIHPIYLEDHSSVHHQPMKHEYHHEEPHYQHHEIEYHHEPQHQLHHEEQHHDGYHEPYQHEEIQHHEPMGHNEEHENQGDFEHHPMMQMMMHGGSGPQPAYQQLASVQAYPNPTLYNHQFQGGSVQDFQSNSQKSSQSSEQQQQQSKAPEQASTQTKPSLLHQAANNPLIAIIKPLFQRNSTKQKKP